MEPSYLKPLIDSVPRCVYFVPFQNLKNAPTYTVHNELKTFMHTSVEIWHFEINCYVFQQIALLQSSPASKVLEQSVNKLQFWTALYKNVSFINETSASTG